MKQVHAEMLKEINDGGAFSRDIEGFNQLVEQGVEDGANATDPTIDAPAPGAGGLADESLTDIPKLVAIANFEPPSSQSTLMLPLVIGDIITVIGQDGKGWWYGKKQNGTEGWFPPSYVQTKAAHYSSPGVPARP